MKLSQRGLGQEMGGGVGIPAGSLALISLWKVVHPYNCLPSGKHKESDQPSGRNSIMVRYLPCTFSLIRIAQWISVSDFE